MYVMKSLQRLFLLVGCTFLKNLPLTFSCCIFRQVQLTCSFWYEGVSLDKKEIKAQYKFLASIELKFRKWMQIYKRVVSRNYQSTFKKFWFYSAILICLILSYDIDMYLNFYGEVTMSLTENHTQYIITIQN